MTLSEKQRLFTRLLPRLLDRIHGQGYECALAEGYVGLSVNTPEERSPHRRDGGHFKKIAQDVDLFRRVVAEDGTVTMEYCTDTESHRPFGEYWERQHPLCRWGGRWGDGTHYSLEDGGVA